MVVDGSCVAVVVGVGTGTRGAAGGIMGAGAAGGSGTGGQKGNLDLGEWDRGEWDLGEWDRGEWDLGEWDRGEWDLGEWDSDRGEWDLGEWDSDRGEWHLGECDSDRGEWGLGEWDSDRGEWDLGEWDSDRGEWHLGEWDSDRGECDLGEWDSDRGEWDLGEWDRVCGVTGGESDSGAGSKSDGSDWDSDLCALGRLLLNGRIGGTTCPGPLGLIAASRVNVLEPLVPGAFLVLDLVPGPLTCTIQSGGGGEGTHVGCWRNTHIWPGGQRDIWLQERAGPGCGIGAATRHFLPPGPHRLCPIATFAIRTVRTATAAESVLIDRDRITVTILWTRKPVFYISPIRPPLYEHIHVCYMYTIHGCDRFKSFSMKGNRSLPGPIA